MTRARSSPVITLSTPEGDHQVEYPPGLGSIEGAIRSPREARSYARRAPCSASEPTLRLVYEDTYQKPRSERQKPCRLLDQPPVLLEERLGSIVIVGDELVPNERVVKVIVWTLHVIPRELFCLPIQEYPSVPQCHHYLVFIENIIELE